MVISWNLGSYVTEIQSRIVSRSNVLNLFDVNATDHGGEYLCAAVNMAGLETSVSILNFKPQFLEQPSSIEVNDTYSFVCTAEAFPFPTYQWQKMESGKFIDIFNETEEILNVTEHEIYRCVVTNVINDVENVIYSEPVTIITSESNG